MSLSQNVMGRAFEYGVAVALSGCLAALLDDNAPFQNAKRCFESCPDDERNRIVRSSAEASDFLVGHDARLARRSCRVSIQSDQQGKYGDVRDIIVRNTGTDEEVGISAKNRHFAVKHSRLSERIDFGTEWLGLGCSDVYFESVVPVFQELANKRSRHEQWKDVPNKSRLYYVPILQAFRQEVESLFDRQPSGAARSLIHYLLGRYDYYKVIKENGSVSVMSFNLRGTLRWGSRVPLPTRVIEIVPKPNSDTTLFLTFDHGWQISFRIHSASTMVEPSLKFDINIVGLPYAMSRHVVEYSR